MAESIYSNKLQIVFTTEGGTTTMSFSHADSEAETTDMMTAANAIVTNGSIFENIPLSVKTVKLVKQQTDTVYPAE